ncbi:LOW QUALITY PROTEIN: uncharacterized protein LOC123551937 [Mercenaria mercenaria]|uniref:LOW QUALITY PROTEIN: uncharacterized protein LOC123551937 n=1 Tax=Mercenaria mercenaria TaxID=6596 RepID=UPI00234F96AB|nr:LOW QUALITY PROTEIN: uncharacterized protein LOC123551937 [Mercenaria mercenaria]
MLGGAYSTQFKNIERQHVDTIKTLAVNEKSDAIARARKLSVETNRRRRALAIKRKSEAEREEKRRQQILAKRREKQQEATEKFQRGHIQSRPGSGSSSGRWSPRRTNIHTQLDDALKIVRGSPASSRASSARTRNQSSPNTSFYRQNSDPLSKPYFNKYAHPSVNNGGHSIHSTHSTHHKQEELHNKSLRNLNNSRNLFEQQLESYQQSLLEQQQNTLREFNKQLMKEIEVDKNVVNNETNGVNGLDRSESLSTVDSLEDGDTNETLRESCDLNAFMTQKNEDSNFANGAKNVTFAGDQNQAIKIYGNNSHIVHSAVNMEPQNIDSYNSQALQAPNQRSEEQKQQFYIQRQKEIQLQLQEQQQKQMLLQQKQQKELQQKVLEQQQKQQQLLQQQYERQKQEELEKQRQEHQQQQAAVSMATTASDYASSEEGKENQRPKVQMKAWATPSPHPPPPASTVITTAQTYVTHASPYTGKNTHTNMTVPMVTSNDQISNSNTPFSVNSNSSVSQTNSSSATRLNDKNVQGNTDVNKREYVNSPSTQDKSLSFLETVTYGLSVTPDSNSTNSTPTTVPKNQSNNGVSDVKPTQQASKTNGNSGAPTKQSTTSANVPKTPIHAGYYNSYGAAYSARQQLTNGTNNKHAVKESAGTVTTQAGTAKMNGEVTWGLPEELAGHLKMMTTEPIMNGDDTGDTDSVSTICEEREPEPKDVKSILKRTGSGKKTGGILKKSGSTGNMKEIRDSLEITRVHLQTSAEEKEQRMLREKERLKNPPPTPTKKNVRFADLCYDDEPEQSGEGDSKLFVKRNNDAVSHKPSRPVSAVTTKTLSPKIDSKPPRASSASTVRTSTIPRAKTQIVRPQAAAHIITQSTQNLDNVNEKVTVVNNNFMEKVPAMARANQSDVSLCYEFCELHTSQQKVNYAVSSIVMPKSESAPFIYPGYNKQGPVPAGSVNGPSQGGNSSKYDCAVYNENGLRIDRTPTDDEINFLWDKLRNCLSRNSQATPDGVQTDGQTGGSRQAAPVAHTYIDGNALGQFNSLNRVAQQPGHNSNTSLSLRRQNSLDSAPNSYTRRYGLLQQRKQQPNPNSLKSRQQEQQQQQQGYTVYQAPVQSNSEPQPSGPIINGADVTESMAGFLAAEQLADQSVSESRIHQAMEEAQSRQLAYNTARPQPKVKSALSVEEQRLMESLDRLNDKLKTAEGVSDMSPQSQPAPQQQQQQQPVRQVAVHRSSFLTADGKEEIKSEEDSVSGFKGHTPITQRRVIEAGNHRARLRITSAHLKQNIHRHQ